MKVITLCGLFAAAMPAQVTPLGGGGSCVLNCGIMNVQPAFAGQPWTVNWPFCVPVVGSNIAAIWLGLNDPSVPLSFPCGVLHADPVSLTFGTFTFATPPCASVACSIGTTLNVPANAVGFDIYVQAALIRGFDGNGVLGSAYRVTVQ